MLLESEGDALLIDAGFSRKETERRLGEAGASLDRVAALLVTHEHADHASGLGRFLRRSGLKVASNAATAAAIHRTFGADGVLPLAAGVWTAFGTFEVRAIEVPHDSAGCTGFEVKAGGKRLVYATDLGGVPTELQAAGAKADAVVLEANHDRKMLWEGSYPQFLKERIAGGRGHLSNEQAASALAAMAGGRLKKVVLAHLSVENNRPQVAVEAVTRELRRGGRLAAFDMEVVAAPKDGPVRIPLA